MNAADQSRCPACGESITAKDASCPSCGISFVADISSVVDGLQKWTPRTVGPADGIYLPLTDVSE
jgi:ribosomal protein S27AE